MNRIADQAELLLRTPVRWVEVPLETIRSKRTAGAAISLACDSAITSDGKALEEKEIYMPLGIDKGYFSNIRSGKATLQADKIKDFCEIVGNNAYVEWLAYQIGYGLVLLKTEAERRAELAEHRADEAEKKLQWAMELMGKK